MSAQKQPNADPAGSRPPPPPAPPQPKRITLIDRRASSAARTDADNTVELEIPASSPWHDLLPDEQTIEIVEPNRERGADSR